MARGAVFVDTAGLIGVFLPKDALHAMASRSLDALVVDSTPLVTTDWVLMEFLNAVASDLRARRTVGGFIRSFLASPSLTLVHASHEGLLDALRFYEQRPDKQWSIVDCASMAICRDMGIGRVFTHDHHFRQAGFEILL